MSKVLLSIALVIFVCSLNAGEPGINEQGVVVSMDPSDVVRSVFIGSDQEMPISADFRISMEPTIEDGEAVIPPSAADAIDELSVALPHWYLSSLLTSTGEYECFVSVNGRYLTFAVIAWIQDSWNLEEPDTPLHKELKRFGAATPPEMAQLIHGGLCAYLKSGKESALNAMKNLADEN